jgi:hypothetical protein
VSSSSGSDEKEEEEEERVELNEISEVVLQKDPAVDVVWLLQIVVGLW